MWSSCLNPLEHCYMWPAHRWLRFYKDIDIDDLEKQTNKNPLINQFHKSFAYLESDRLWE